MTRKPKRSKRSSDDEVLLLHAMFLMSRVDGHGSVEEQRRVLDLVRSFPVFRDADVEYLVNASKKLVEQYGGLLESLEAFTALRDSVTRAQCYLLAAEVAYASGDVNAAEAQLLDSMGALLRLEKDQTSKILEVVALRYAAAGS